MLIDAESRLKRNFALLKKKVLLIYFMKLNYVIITSFTIKIDKIYFNIIKYIL